MTNNAIKIRYYLTTSGRSPVKEFVDAESFAIQTGFADAVALLEDGVVLSMPLSRPLSNICTGLHELRLKDRHGQVRVFYFIKKCGLIFMLHATHKKTQEIPKREVDIILKRTREILYAVEDSHSR